MMFLYHREDCGGVIPIIQLQSKLNLSKVTYHVELFLKLPAIFFKVIRYDTSKAKQVKLVVLKFCQHIKLQTTIYTHYTYARESEAEISPLEIFKTRNLQQKL